MRWTLALLFVTLSLAGCADQGDDATPSTIVDEDDADLQSGKGALNGLLVDDRFRPIQLTDDPETEFQAAGFILVQELGLRLQTTENGEFQVLDMEPGTYTLRFQIAGHEAPPAKVTIKEGEFTEENFIARRILDSGAAILTQEFTIWSDCWISTPVTLGNEMNCYQDYSGDSLIGGFQTSYAAVADTMTYLVTEAFVDQQGYYDIYLGVSYDGDASIDDNYAKSVIRDGQYTKIVNQKGALWEDNENYKPLDDEQLTYPVLVTNFPRDRFRDELNDAMPVTPNDLFLSADEWWGPEAGLAVKTKVLQSAFLGEPDVDLEAYCILCI